MDKLALSRLPVEPDLVRYRALFMASTAHDDDFLGHALSYVRQREGKMMRPILTLLMARELGPVSEDTLRAAVTLELLHTASLVHDDVVDESGERRGQRSVNAVYDNKVAVLLGDYLLSKSLLVAAETNSIEVVKIISRLGGTLSEGEIYQLANIRKERATEEAYFHIIAHKTAALFSACARLGALTAGGAEGYIARAARLGELIGICFQIRDDIFDYFPSPEIGKPSGNDMLEGKLTLPAIYALSQTDKADPHDWARRVKQGTATADDIARLVDFTVQGGGIDYARRRMETLHTEALQLIEQWDNEEVRKALGNYFDFVIERKL